MNKTFLKFVRILKEHAGVIPPKEKGPLYRAVSKGEISHEKLQKLKRISLNVKKNNKPSKKAMFKANEAASKPEGHTPANELSTSDKLEKTLPKNHTPSISDDEPLIKRKRPKRKLVTDDTVEKTAKRLSGVAKVREKIGEKFIRNKRAQIRLIKVIMKKKPEFAEHVKELGGVKKYVNSKLGQQYIRDIIRRHK